MLLQTVQAMRKRRILLVDDEIALARMLAEYLTETGDYEVRVEHRGRGVVAAAREFQPDLVVLDIMMPDVDGGAVASALHADPALRSTPVVFLTGLVSPEETAGGSIHIGGYPVLAKPVHPETMLACIAKEVRADLAVASA
jgi:two-component system, OmpR family, response regulator